MPRVFLIRRHLADLFEFEDDDDLDKIEEGNRCDFQQGDLLFHDIYIFLQM